MWHDYGKVVKSHNAICVRSMLDVVVGVGENYRITEVGEKFGHRDAPPSKAQIDFLPSLSHLIDNCKEMCVVECF